MEHKMSHKELWEFKSQARTVEVLSLIYLEGEIKDSVYTPDQLLTTKECCVLLHLPVKAIYRIVKRSEITFYKSENKLHFTKQNLLDWVVKKRMNLVSLSNAITEKYILKTKKGKLSN